MLAHTNLTPCHPIRSLIAEFLAEARAPHRADGDEADDDDVDPTLD